MKYARNALVLMILLVTPLLLSGVFTPFQIEVRSIESPSLSKTNTLSYETHDTIWIQNDTAFHNMASAEDWDGDGSPATPYIIEGYNITADFSCILVQHVSLSFEIRNCFLSGISSFTGAGIGIIDSPLVSIDHTIIQSKAVGMELEELNSSAVRFCTLTNNSGVSIYGLNSEGLIIDNCEVYDSYGTGIQLFNANETLITDCKVENILASSGIHTLYSHSVTIINSEISDCEHHGIWIELSSYATIENNDIHDNEFPIAPMCGVYIDNSDYATIVGNDIYDNSRNGIYIHYSDWSYIFNNEVHGNSDHGIYIWSSDNGTISQNNIHGNGWWPVMINSLCGIFLGPSEDLIISDNSIWNNTPNGISIEGAEQIQISNNHIFNNTNIGIYGDSGGIIIIVLEISELAFTDTIDDVLLISENVIHNNGVTGIQLDGFDECRIVDNEIYNHTDHGIEFWGNWYQVIGNEVYNCETGIGSYECYNNTFSENMVYDCLGGIYIVNIGSNITNNIVFDNEYGIYMHASGNCSIYGNDIGWNTVNAYELNTFPDKPLTWYNNVTKVGNWWHNYNYSGFYNITTDTGIDSQDLFPSKSLELSQATPISFEILETGNIVHWDASALNPSHYEVFVDGSSILVEDWDGNDIEYLAEGFSHGIHTIELTVYHISGHSMGNSTTAAVEDLTPPVVSGVILTEIVLGDDINIEYVAVDPSGIFSWAVNDTTHFALSSSGILTNIVELEVGTYYLLLEIADPYGNAAHLEVTIIVTSSGGSLPTTLILAIGSGAAIIILVVVAIGYKTKRG